MDELARRSLVAGRYEVVRLLGQGSAKCVYLADDKLTGDAVALAMLRADSPNDDTVQARFKREGRIGSRLNSPFIVRVLDVGALEDRTMYLVTEAVIGRSLEDALAHGAVAPDLAVRWTLQVLAALGEAHGLGIVHRDVKPGNVLLARSADGEFAKLTDFGIAKLLDTSVEMQLTVQTAANVLMGTPQYMSPEQWQSTKIDARSDLYATAVMLYELLLGHFPFDADTLESLCLAHLAAEPKPFPDDGPALMRAVAPIVMRTLAKEPEQRFVSAQAMSAAIEAATGLSAHDGDAPELVFPARFARAELLSDLWPASIQLVMAPVVVLGRGDDAHVTVNCLPEDDETRALTKMVSHAHAQIEWRGGRAWIADLGSKTGTFVGEAQVGREAVELASDDEIAVGMHARFLFEHAPVRPGELPAWAKLTRIDPWGAGRQHVIVLTSAVVGPHADAAIVIPADYAGGDAVRFHVGADGLVVDARSANQPMPLHDGQVMHVGALELLVVIDE